MLILCTFRSDVAVEVRNHEVETVAMVGFNARAIERF